MAPYILQRYIVLLLRLPLSLLLVRTLANMHVMRERFALEDHTTPIPLLDVVIHQWNCCGTLCYVQHYAYW